MVSTNRMRAARAKVEKRWRDEKLVESVTNDLEIKSDTSIADEMNATDAAVTDETSRETIARHEAYLRIKSMTEKGFNNRYEALRHWGMPGYIDTRKFFSI